MNDLKYLVEICMAISLASLIASILAIIFSITAIAKAIEFNPFQSRKKAEIDLLFQHLTHLA